MPSHCYDDGVRIQASLHRMRFMAAAALVACATPVSVGERPRLSAGDLDQVHAVLKRDFHANGQATMDRIQLDELQRACNLHADNPPPEVAKRIEEAQLKAVKFPSDGFMGDWKRGERIAQSGRGAMWSDKPGVQEGGSCYNCHQISPREEAFGTVGPSLAGFGKVRGNRPEIQQYVYGQNHPGLLDAGIPVVSYPDMVTQTIHVGDCELLERYMDFSQNPKWARWDDRTWLIGLNAGARGAGSGDAGQTRESLRPWLKSPCCSGWRRR